MTHWVQRAKSRGDGAVGRLDEDHTEQAKRIELLLSTMLPDKFYQHSLDFGGGWGRFSKLLASMSSHVWSVDVVPEWTARCSRGEPTVTGHQLTDPTLPFDNNSMDLIIDFMTTQGISDSRVLMQCMAELRRVATSDATVVSLRKFDAEDITPVLMAAHFGLSHWSAVMTKEVDAVGDLYYMLVGKVGACG